MSTLDSGLQHLTDRELLLITAEKVTVLEAHARTTNGHIAEIKGDLLRAEGALSFGKWLFAAVFVLIGAGVGLAGLILALVAA